MQHAAPLPERAELMRSVFGSDWEDSDDADEEEVFADDEYAADAAYTAQLLPPVQCLPCNPSTHLAVVLGGDVVGECLMALSPRIARDKKTRRAAAHTLIGIRKCLRADMANGVA